MFVGCWAHKFVGALGSYDSWGLGFLKSLWGFGLIKFLGFWAHKIYRAFENLCGCRLIKFVGSWIHRIFGALGS